jgi:hypothetical protein
LYNTSNINLNNETYITGKNTSGTYYNLLGVDSANYMKIGNETLTTIIGGYGALFNIGGIANLVSVYSDGMAVHTAFSANSVSSATGSFGTSISSGTGIFSSTVTSSGFIKSGSSDSYVLLGGGGVAYRNSVINSVMGSMTYNSNYVTSCNLNAYQEGRIVVIQGSFTLSSLNRIGPAYFTLPSGIYPPTDNIEIALWCDSSSCIKLRMYANTNYLQLSYHAGRDGLSYMMTLTYRTSTVN